MLGEGSSIEEIDKELAVIWAQKGYMLNVQGFNEEGLKLYQKALDSTLSDVFVKSLTIYNQATANPVDFAKMQLAIDNIELDNIKSKLNNDQKEIFAYNTILFNMMSSSV